MREPSNDNAKKPKETESKEISAIGPREKVSSRATVANGWQLKIVGGLFQQNAYNTGIAYVSNP